MELQKPLSVMAFSCDCLTVTLLALKYTFAVEKWHDVVVLETVDDRVSLHCVAGSR